MLTSVDRDELPDQGANHFAETVRQIKKRSPKLLIECLTPDFRGEELLIKEVALSGLNVYAHNVETVKRLQRRVRDYRAGYEQSINVLKIAKKYNPKLITKTSIMLGLGEEDEEIRQTLKDLRENDVDVVTFGQYLRYLYIYIYNILSSFFKFIYYYYRPTRRHISVQKFVKPEEFANWQTEAQNLGFKYVASGPLVRSSYRAGELYLHGLLKEREKIELKNN